MKIDTVKESEIENEEKRLSKNSVGGFKSFTFHRQKSMK